MKNDNSYKGSLSLDWINKDFSLYYEIDEKNSRGVRPVWVSKNDIRVAEPRILTFAKNYGNPANENMLIKGDNLLVLRSLVEMFKGKKDKDKIKCIYIDPPFNTGSAFEYYDDNLQHSEWLTMMRDRLSLLNKLLKKDGVIFAHIDNQEVAYLKILMDEEFGRNNFVQIVTVKRASPAGFKTINPGPVTVSDYILIYAKDKKEYIKHFKPYYLPVGYDENYNLMILNPSVPPERWKFKKIGEIVLKEKGFRDWRAAKKEWGKEWKLILNSFAADFALKNADRIVSVRDPHKPSEKIKELLKKSKENKDKVFVLERDDKQAAYFLNGGALSFYKNKLKIVDGELTPTELLTDVWVDINFAGIAKEGDVQFKNSKKPEMLLRRIIESSTEVGDLVFDSFAGSGTTGAVAHKLNRRWIMVELGRHADKLIIPRMQRVVTGKDQAGISKETGWQGGSGFKYYKLGKSVIYDNDMNWQMKAEEMAEAVFLHFQYKMEQCDWLKEENMYLGKHRDTPYQFAVCFASREMTVLKEKLYEKIMDFFVKERKFKCLTIFTNMPVAVSIESMDNRILIEKIPAKILREYNLI